MTDEETALKAAVESKQRQDNLGMAVASILAEHCTSPLRSCEAMGAAMNALFNTYIYVWTLAGNVALTDGDDAKREAWACRLTAMRDQFLALATPVLTSANPLVAAEALGATKIELDRMPTKES